MTATGLLVIPVTMALMFCRWRHLIVFMVIVSGLLADSAVVNFANFGIQPGYFVLLAALTRAFIELLLRNEPIRRDVAQEYLPLLVLAVASMLALLIGSAFHDGTIMVQSSRDGQDGPGSPFHLRLENYAQHFYLALNALGALIVAHKISRMPSAEARLVMLRTFYGFIWVSGAIVFWQWAHYTFGLWFPDKEFFHNNVAYAEAYGQNLSDFGYRLCGSFAEPSALGYFFTGALFFAYRHYEAERSTLALSGLMICLLLLLFSTSTAAYLVLVLFGLTLVWRRHRLVGPRSTARTPALHGLLCFAAAILLAVFLVTHAPLVYFVVKTFIIDKPGGASVSVRSNADWMALQIAFQTWGVGLGLGSHKANTLPMTLISNAGVVGLLAFCWFVIGHFRYARQRIHEVPGLDRTLMPMQWFLVGLLIQHCVTNPNFNMGMFWLVFGMLAGVGAAARVDAGARIPMGSFLDGMPFGRAAQPVSWKSALP
jgi:hypothetical protein